MSADDPKATASLASWFAEMYCHDTDRMPDEIAYHERILAALRAVEAVRALHYEQSNGVEMACRECGHRFPCPTVRALLGSER